MDSLAANRIWWTRVLKWKGRSCKSISNIASSGERVSGRPKSSIMRVDTIDQNGDITRHNQHICSRDPTCPNCLQHKEDEDDDIWARRLGVRYHLKWILRINSKWLTHLENFRRIAAACSHTSEGKVWKSSDSHLEICDGVSATLGLSQDRV